MLVVRSLPEVQGGYDDAGCGQPATVVDTDGPVQAVPRATVGVDQSQQRRGRRALRPVHAGQQLLALRLGVDDVGFLDFVGRARIEANGHGLLLLVRAHSITLSARSNTLRGIVR